MFRFIIVLCTMTMVLPFGFTDSVAAEITVNGTVTEEGTGAPVPDATVVFISAASDTVKTITDNDGKYVVLLNEIITSIDNAVHPEAVVLRQNYPNPFNPTTIIEYQLSGSGRAQLSIYNIMGQKVRTLVDGYHETGLHRIKWDGRDENGRGVAAGVYVYQLKTGGQSLFRKMLLLDGGGSGSASRYLSAAVSFVRTVGKPAVNAKYTLSVKREGYVTFENYMFNVPVSGRVNVVLQKKSGATLYGSIKYDQCYKCRTDNWNGIIDPINIIVYDTNDYSKKLADFTIEYPDTTFEVTGLPEGVADVVVQGDDVISIKSPELILAEGDNELNNIRLIILYNLDTSIRPFVSGTSFDTTMKKLYDRPDLVENIFKDIGATFHKYHIINSKYWYFGGNPENDIINSAKIVRILNNDQRTLFSEVGTYYVTY